MEIEVSTKDAIFTAQNASPDIKTVQLFWAEYFEKNATDNTYNF